MNASVSEGAPAETSSNIYYLLGLTIIAQTASLIMQVISKCKKSKCCGSEFEFKSSNSVRNTTSSPV